MNTNPTPACADNARSPRPRALRHISPLRQFRTIVLCAAIGTGAIHAEALTSAEGEARARMAMQIAREHNDKALVDKVAASAKALKAAFESGDLPAAENRLRDAETAVGIDPGGWSMAGQPLFHPTAAMKEKSKELDANLAAAMRSGDIEKVQLAARAMLAMLGDQAGVPDGRRPGVRPGPLTVDAPGATRLFMNALKSDSKRVRELSKGKPLPDQMARLYAYILQGVCAARPGVEKVEPGDLPKLDQLADGVVRILLRIQQPEGHFPFPDLRGKNIRFGEMIEKQLALGTVQVKDGWVLTADPQGGTQFDTGLCGAALLAAGQLYQQKAWTDAGLRAADWALRQECVANYNYNSFSVSLLARAHMVTGNAQYLDGALKKFRLGVAPGIATNGRWMDPHNARTVYHVIILRALGDLGAALGNDRPAEQAELDAITRPAIKALLDEFDAMGITVEALPEMLVLSSRYPDDQRLKTATIRMAASLVEKSTDGIRVKMGAPPHQLAAIPEAAGFK